MPYLTIGVQVYITTTEFEYTNHKKKECRMSQYHEKNHRLMQYLCMSVVLMLYGLGVIQFLIQTEPEQLLAISVTVLLAGGVTLFAISRSASSKKLTSHPRRIWDYVLMLLWFAFVVALSSQWLLPKHLLALQVAAGGVSCLVLVRIMDHVLCWFADYLLTSAKLTHDEKLMLKTPPPVLKRRAF